MINSFMAISHDPILAITLLGLCLSMAGLIWLFAMGQDRIKEIKSWCESFGFNFSAQQNPEHFQSSYLSRNSVKVQVGNVINTGDLTISDVNVEQLIGKSHFVKNQSVITLETNESFPHTIIQPLTLNYQIEESITRTLENFSYKEIFAAEHVLMTNHNSQAMSYINSRFIELVEQFEDYYIEFLDNKVHLCKPELLVPVEDFQHFLEDAKEIFASLELASDSTSEQKTAA